MAEAMVFVFTERESWGVRGRRSVWLIQHMRGERGMRKEIRLQFTFVCLQM